MKRALVIAAIAAALGVGATPASGSHAAAHGQHRGRPDTRHVLVRFRSGTPLATRAALRAAVGARVAGALGPERIDVLELPRGARVDAALARLRRSDAIELAQPNRAYTIDATPNDPGYADLWGLDNSGQSGGVADADVDAPEAWDVLGLARVGGTWAPASFTVGVVDTGVDTGHEDLSANLTSSCSSALTGTGTLTPGCLDDNGHGTHVAGSIAATGNNSTGVVGVAPQARVRPCKALDSTGTGYDADIAACINDFVARRSSEHIAVISMSLGGNDGSDALAAAVEYAWQHGVLVVAAAGNDGNGSTEYPAGYAQAVSVAATDRRDAHARFSNANADVEVSAPGVDIVSTVPTYPTNPTEGFWDPSGYAAADGTSMATPYAAAVAALIAWRTGKSGAALRDALDAAVDDLGPTGRDSQFGYGRVNACLGLGAACGYRGKVTAPPYVPTDHAFRPSSYKVVTGSVFKGRGELGRLFADDGQRVQITGRTDGSRYRSDLYATVSATKVASLTRLRVDYDGNLTTSDANLRLMLYDWTSRAWTSVYFKHGGLWTSDRVLTWSTATGAQRFVSPSGAVRVRVQAGSASGLRTRTDLIRVTLTY